MTYYSPVGNDKLDLEATRNDGNACFVQASTVYPTRVICPVSALRLQADGIVRQPNAPFQRAAR